MSCELASLNNVVLVSVIQGGAHYADRVKFLYSLDSYLHEHFILIRDEPRLIPDLQNTRIIWPKFYLPSFLFALWAAIVSYRLIVAKGGNRWIVNQYNNWFATAILKFVLKKRIVACSSFFEESRTMYFKKSWKIDPFVGILDTKQALHNIAAHWYQTIKNKFAIYWLDCIFCNSPGIRSEILKQRSRQNVYLVPNSIDFDKAFLKVDSCKDQSEGVSFLFVGKMCPGKGLGTLFEAFKRHNLNRVNDRLVLVGRCSPIDSAWFQRLLRKYSGCCNYIYKGALERRELEKVYSACDVFVFTSFFEGSPRVILEALCLGLPILASDLPGIRLIDNEGKAINYFSPFNVADLTEKLSYFSRDSFARHHYGSCTREIVQRFSHEIVAKIMVQHLNSLINLYS